MGCTCVRAQVSLEVRALGVGLAASRVLTAVDGRPFLTRWSPCALPPESSRGQVLSDQQGLLVVGLLDAGLSVGVLAERGSVAVVKVRHVAAVVSGQLGRGGLRLQEPAVREGQHQGVLQRVVRGKVTG